MIRRLLSGVAAACALCALATPASAADLTFPFEARFPADGVPGEGAGRMDQPHGIATNPVNHHLYVTEIRNRRVSEFTAWGEFVRAFGWGVRNGDPELQTCTSATGCLKGLPGSGPGQFGEVPEKSQYKGPTGIAIDSSGNVYAMDLGNFRVQKFDSEGNLILTFGGKVNATTGGNLCTKASGDTCVAGQLGTGPGEFAIENKQGVNRDYLAVGPDDTVYVGDKDRIQVFNPDGSFKASIPLPEPGNPGSLEVDPTNGNLYFAFNQLPGSDNAPSVQPGVYRLSPSGEVLEVLPAERPHGLAVDPAGNLYVVSDPPADNSVQRARVVKFDPAGNQLGEFGGVGVAIEMPGIAIGVVGQSPADIDVYAAEYRFNAVAAVNIYGAIPDPDVVGPPPLEPPEVTDQFAASVGATEAAVRARINPRFWDDTRYHVQYGLEDCAVSSCASTPSPPGSKLTNQITNASLLSGGVLLSGLEPATTYHYRFAAQSSGGGPVFGPDRTFTTAAAPGPGKTDCPNQAFRTGPGAFLPDCRAYELVTPADKFADIDPLPDINSQPAGFDKASEAGGKLTFAASRAFGEDPPASPYTSQYLAERDPQVGWESRQISPPRNGPTLLEASGLDSQFKLFGEDLCSAWFLQDTDLSLAPEAVPGYPNLYRADLCSGPAVYEAMTQLAPPQRPPGKFLFEVQGGGDGHTVYRANDALSPGAPPVADSNLSRVYDYFEGETAPVCVLPSGTQISGGCSVGTAENVIGTDWRTGRVQGAVSEDGSRIFWTGTQETPTGTFSTLYLRVDGEFTVAVSKAKGQARFWGAAADGSRVIFTEETTKELFEFEPDSDLPEAGTRIAGQVIGVAAISRDASRVYYASREDLDAGGPAEAGKANLYLHEEGAGERYVATFSESDVTAPLSSLHPQPYKHAAQATPDGGALAFMSNNALTGRDSRELGSSAPTAQVYLYDAASGELTCASCNPTGARPVGQKIDERLKPDPGASPPFLWTSGLLTPPPNQLQQPRSLSPDGTRLFFTSFDALVPRDTNGAGDVYEWQRVSGREECEEQIGGVFSAPNGCLGLISSGKSQTHSRFVDASADGSDVFFKTDSSLVGQDTGLIDIYDARIGGGFPPPPPAPLECEGEACQSPAPAPIPPTPSSSSFQGPGDPKTGVTKHRQCPKGKRKVRRAGKTRCVRVAKPGAKQRKHVNHRKGGRR